MRSAFDRMAWLLPPAFALHVAEEAPGFTAWVRRNACERYTQRDFVRINALGLAITGTATVAVTRRANRGLDVTYYSLIATQQALFNAIFHVGATAAFREYSPGLVTSLVNVLLWKRLTAAALAERRLTVGGAIACTVAAGLVHAAAVARQVFCIRVAQ